ncbi:diguanylate cyclase [Pseudomonas sp. MDMC224]|nr:diguanylate cyclase [Pseudomonas sp. MDMC224]
MTRSDRRQRTSVGAGSPANTGEAGASHRGACFAGKPAPTGLCT